MLMVGVMEMGVVMEMEAVMERGLTMKKLLGLLSGSVLVLSMKIMGKNSLYSITSCSEIR